MSLKYPELFSPFNIGKCKIKNRIVMAPMGITGITEESGKFSNEALNFYEERAKGGTGLIISCCFGNNAGVEQTKMDGPFDDPYNFGIHARRLVDRVHNHGCKVFMQIAVGAGRVGFPLTMEKPPAAPSVVANRWIPSLMCREMTNDEVKRIISAVAQNALVCKNAGADGVEIHSVYGGYLGDQFSMSLFNQRTDEYGGDLRGRLKVACDIVKEIKELCGNDFPVSLRFGAKHYMKGIGQGALPGETFEELGRDIEESIEAAKILEAAGYDALNIANGSYDSWYWAHPPMYQKDGCWLDTASIIKKAVSIPVICAGKINMPEMANDAIKNQMVDGIALGRALLADDHWAKKANLGRDDLIRPCIACHSGCMARIFAGKTCTCAVNPAVGREKEYEVTEAKFKKNICVIGGGVAGMEAARIAAQRGHEVNLYEKTNGLGGALRPASVPEFKDADRKLIQWYEREVREAGVKVHLNTEMTIEKLSALNPDETLVATGAKPKMPQLLGVEYAVTAIDVLMGNVEVGSNCVIVGGGQVGCEVAIWLKEQGKNVTVIEAMSALMMSGAEELCVANRLMLVDMLDFNEIEVRLNTKLLDIKEGSIQVIGEHGVETIEADTAIISIGYYSDREFYEKLVQEVPNVWYLGDQNTPTNIMYAVADGAALGRSV